MAGNLCFCCGLDFRTVKLYQVSTFDEKGRPVTVTACDACRGMLIKGNHPENQQAPSQDANVQGFVKPSQDDKPAVRPQ